MHNIELTNTFFVQFTHIASKYVSLISWCVDQGYYRVYTKSLVTEYDHFHLDAQLYFEESRIIISTISPLLRVSLEEAWIHDKKLAVINPRFKYNVVVNYNGDGIHRLRQWFKQNIDDTRYHFYYCGYERSISFKYQEDYTFYRMVFCHHH